MNTVCTLAWKTKWTGSHGHVKWYKTEGAWQTFCFSLGVFDFREVNCCGCNGAWLRLTLFMHTAIINVLLFVCLCVCVFRHSWSLERTVQLWTWCPTMPQTPPRCASSPATSSSPTIRSSRRMPRTLFRSVSWPTVNRWKIVFGSFSKAVYH